MKILMDQCFEDAIPSAREFHFLHPAKYGWGQGRLAFDDNGEQCILERTTGLLFLLVADSDDVNSRFRADVNNFLGPAALAVLMMPGLFT